MSGATLTVDAYQAGEGQPEEWHQVRLFQEIDAYRPDFPELALAHHVPLGGLRARKTAGLLRAQGTREGIPDLILPSPRAGYAGLALELKSFAGHADAAQREMLGWYAELGHLAVICRGWRPAWRLVLWYEQQPASVALPPRAPHPIHQVGFSGLTWAEPLPEVWEIAP